ncbi:DUF1120 domain-containing protein [Glaciimonas sp. GG7]
MIHFKERISVFAKKMTRYFLCIVVTSISAHVLAATTAELIVKSTIIPSGCTVEFSNSVLDYGDIPAETLSPIAVTELKPLSTTFTITCNAATKIQYRLEDNRQASIPIGLAEGNHVYGLGMQNGDGKIGYYSIDIEPDSAKGDGMPATSIYNASGGTLRRGWSHSAGRTSPDKQYFMSFAEFGTYVPTSFTTFSGVITVTPKIVPTDNLNMGREIDLDGSATLEIVYL